VKGNASRARHMDTLNSSQTDGAREAFPFTF
jgi:hypothetical protein